jgi:predicted helicase
MTTRPVSQRAAIKAANSLDDLLIFLRDQLDWPIPPEMDLEDAGVKVDPSEIHLDPKSAAKMTNIYRLLPPTGDESFGVYFVEFSGGKFPVGAVKRLLERVVKKRRSKKSGHVGRWGKDDLIFVTRTDDAGGRAHLTAFETDHDTNRTKIKVISWGKGDTDARIQRLITEELPRLRWPEAGQPLDNWITDAREVFRLGVREEIRTSEKLAKRMAEVAIDARDEVLGLLEVESDTGPLRKLYHQIKEKLVADIDERGFADMFAQTLVYGLLVARLTNPKKFATDASVGIVDFGTPLLDVLYKSFRDPSSDFDLDELGLVELANELRLAPVEKILDNFGAADRRDDPVVHFYEDFLDFFDKDQRKELGAYYTVVPVVQFMVRAVDEVLRTQFSLELGIADASTWKEVSERNGFKIPKGVKSGNQFVKMVDPATGTGTFLLEWIRVAKQRFVEANGGNEKDWPKHLTEHVIPNMAGLEISLASYAVAHLKTAFEIPRGTGAVGRMPIFLTNTMQPTSNNVAAQLFGDPLSEESHLADHVKSDPGVTVVIGNPPYKDKVKGEGPVVELPFNGTKPLLDAFTPAPERNLGAHTKLLRNRYVFFWRWALDRVFGTAQDEPGVVAFITSAAWLRGPVFETMRSFLRDGNHVWVVDLGGALNSNIPGDENVFSQITTATAICIVSKVPNSGHGQLRYASISGSRQSKFEWLDSTGLFGSDWTILESALTEPITEKKSSEWLEFIPLLDLMPFHANGIHQQRTWVNDPSKKVLKERWQKLVNARVVSRHELMKETSSRKLSSTGIDLELNVQLGPLNQGLNQDPASIVRYSFRTLDRQWLLADSRVIDRPSPELWEVRGSKQLFFTMLNAIPIELGPVISVAGWIPNLNYFKGNSGGKVLPIFRDKTNLQWNLLPGFLDLLNIELAGSIDESTLFSYIAGITAFPAFAARFSDDLREGGVRLPISLQSDLVNEVADLGSTAIELFTYCEKTLNRVKVQNTVRLLNGPHILDGKSAIRGMPEAAVYESETQTMHLGELAIGGVTEAVWNYQVSGMHVIRKWIGYRKAQPSAKWSSPLNDIVTESWPKAWTEELLDLLHVITQLRSLEERHESLLEKVLAGPVLSNSSLQKAGLLPAPEFMTKPAKPSDGIL